MNFKQPESKIDLQYIPVADFKDIQADELIPAHLHPTSFEFRSKIADIALEYLNNRTSKLPATEAGIWELRVHLWSKIYEDSSNT